MEPNHQYIFEKCGELSSCEDTVILDYGCGLGEIVKQGRERGVQIYGVERFYGGSDIRESVNRDGLLGDTIREIDENGTIPFDDEYFDVVVSNQVFEHVDDLEGVINEIGRVLKTDGQLLCLFPSKDVIREGHCGIPIVHWLPKDSKLRYYCLLTFRVLGLGYHKGRKSRAEWSADFQEWLREFTHYRSRSDIKVIFDQVFESVQPMEDDYMSFRLRLRGFTGLATIVRNRLAKPFFREVCRKLAGLVFVARKT